ncbi:hypothetical protein FHS57_001644 [Runella defluvii]|uniref:DUF481 domain-containing protein n=1 Tax=Runella defluvii TaxID=370973 RepID=A0A7W6EPS3_9BACT|nr:hypothetical protein [Runella defluvii]MBB3837647.1 hypothetical protein [Runella defluvii]
MMKRLLIIGLVTALGARAQKPQEKFFSRLSLRQSFQGKLEREEAAYLNLVYPKGDTNSFNYSVAVGYQVLNINLTQAKLRPFVELQKNTLIKNKQDVVLSGLDFQSPLWDVLKNARSWTPYVTSKVNYKKDNVKKTEGAQGSLYVSPVFNGKDGKFTLLPDAVTDVKDSVLLFYYNLYGGVEYEDRNSSNKASSGDVWRLAYRLTANLTLWKKVEIIPDYISRQLIYRTTDTEKTRSELFKLTCNFILAEKSKNKFADIKIGIDHTKGVDPTKGFDNQEFTTITFKMKI